jgi:transcriptional regulator with XRE-family HTH domain
VSTATATADRDRVHPLSLQIGRAVHRLREREGWPLPELAGRAGMSVAMLSALENGRRNFTVPMLDKLAAALDVELRVLFPPRPCPRCKGRPRKGWICGRCDEGRPA